MHSLFNSKIIVGLRHTNALGWSLLFFVEYFSTKFFCYGDIKGLGLVKSTSFPSGDLPTVGVEPKMPDNSTLYKPWTTCTAARLF